MESPPSRRGAASRTRDRLLDAAETLFAKKGGAVTTRAILRLRDSAMSRRCITIWRTAGLMGPCTSGAWTSCWVSGGVHRKLLNRKGPSAFRILSGFTCNPLPASRAVMRAFSPTSRGSLTWCVPLKGSLRRSDRYDRAPELEARQRLVSTFSGVPFSLLRQRFNLGRRFILMAMVQWLRRHGHFRGKAAKAFLADLPRLMEALLQAPAEAP